MRTAPSLQLRLGRSETGGYPGLSGFAVPLGKLLFSLFYKHII